MNKSFVKLLQSFAGVALLSMASFSMAASYDFDADEDERGGQPLNFGDLNVYGAELDGSLGSLGDAVAKAYDEYRAGGGASAYLDAGYQSGLGVCGDVFLPGQTGGNNKCNPGNDDNLTVDEVLLFVFDTVKAIGEVNLFGNHKGLIDGSKVLVATDTNGFQLLNVIGGKIELGFSLTKLAVFGAFSNQAWGAGTDVWDVGKNHNQLYVAGINEVPIPAAAWLFGSALLGLTGLRRRKVAA